MKLLITRRRALSAVIVLFISTLGASAAAQVGGINRRVVAQAENYTGDRFSYTTDTPHGAHVITRVRPRPEWLRAVDDGLTDLFAVARKHGYRSHLNYSDYVIFIAKPDRTRDSTGAYSPDVAYVAPSYAGSIYDQGGYIYAAGATTVQLGAFNFLLEGNGVHSSVRSDVGVREGEKVVVGTAGLKDKALILVLTAKLLK